MLEGMRVAKGHLVQLVLHDLQVKLHHVVAAQALKVVGHRRHMDVHLQSSPGQSCELPQLSTCCREGMQGGTRAPVKSAKIAELLCADAAPAAGGVRSSRRAHPARSEPPAADCAWLSGPQRCSPCAPRTAMSSSPAGSHSLDCPLQACQARGRQM